MKNPTLWALGGGYGVSFATVASFCCVLLHKDVKYSKEGPLPSSYPPNVLRNNDTLLWLSQISDVVFAFWFMSWVLLFYSRHWWTAMRCELCLGSSMDVECCYLGVLVLVDHVRDGTRE